MTDVLDTSDSHNQIPINFGEKVRSLSELYMGGVAVLGGGSNAIFRPNSIDPRIVVDTDNDDEITTTYQIFRLDQSTGQLVTEVSNTHNNNADPKVRSVTMSDEALIMSLFDPTIIANSIAARAKFKS